MVRTNSYLEIYDRDDGRLSHERKDNNAVLARHNDKDEEGYGKHHKDHYDHKKYKDHDKFDIYAGPEGDGLGGELKTFQINITEIRTSLTNGSNRFHYALNDQVYGEPIIFNEGDEVEFIFDNYAFEETSIHLHGLLQQLSPWSDGVPGISSYT